MELEPPGLLAAVISAVLAGCQFCAPAVGCFPSGMRDWYNSLVVL